MTINAELPIKDRTKTTCEKKQSAINSGCGNIK